MPSSCRPLADIELQLIMRALDLTSLLRFARCSQRCFRAASSLFAVHFVTVRVTIPDTQQHFARIRSSRGQSTLDLFHLRGPDHGVQELGLPLHELDASHCIGFACARWKPLLRHPIFQTLRALRLHASFTREEIDVEIGIILALPRLHTLDIRRMRAYPAAWGALPHATQLTSLTINDSGTDDRRRLLPIIAQCAQLRQLRVVQPALYGGAAFSACFCSLALRSLHDLTLDDLNCSGSMLRQAVSAEDYASGFRNLSSLHRLTLRHVCCIDSILPHLHHAPALCSLTIMPQCFREAEGSTTPTPFALVKLLHCCPQLYCTLHFQMSLLSHSSEGHIRAVRAQEQRFSSDDLLQQLGARFQVRCPSECLKEPASNPVPLLQRLGASLCAVQ